VPDPKAGSLEAITAKSLVRAPTTLESRMAYASVTPPLPEQLETIRTVFALALPLAKASWLGFVAFLGQLLCVMAQEPLYGELLNAPKLSSDSKNFNTSPADQFDVVAA
jgi:hypothetical protein